MDLDSFGEPQLPLTSDVPPTDDEALARALQREENSLRPRPSRRRASQGDDGDAEGEGIKPEEPMSPQPVKREGAEPPQPGAHQSPAKRPKLDLASGAEFGQPLAPPRAQHAQHAPVLAGGAAAASKEDFAAALVNFYGAPARWPAFGGGELDLYRLFHLVTSRGGFQVSCSSLPPQRMGRGSDRGIRLALVKAPGRLEL
mmetsp:Transcript_3160/g.10571  ORF Transcript_3160/g.10571 Transcript_3160/m.10571 type:complete len:200 (+) Transcript_3160:274-873(+)